MVGEFFVHCLQSCLCPWHSLATTSSTTPRYVTMANKLTFLSLFPPLKNSFPSRAVMWAEWDDGYEVVQEFVIITVEGPGYRRLLWSWSFKSSLTQKDDLGQVDCFKWSSFSFHPDPWRNMERWLSPWRNKSLIPVPDAGPGSKAVVSRFRHASESPGSVNHHWCLQSTPRISDAVVPGWDPSISTSNKFPDTAAAVQDTTLWDSLKEKNYRPDTVRCSSCSPFSQHSQLYFLSAEEDMFSFHRLVWTLLPSFPIHGQKWKSLALSD